MVVLLLPDAKASKWVNVEIAVAERRGLRIFPVLLIGDENTAVPFALAVTQYVDARQDLRQAVSLDLLPALRRRFHLPEPTLPTSNTPTETAAADRSGEAGAPTRPLRKEATTFRHYVPLIVIALIAGISIAGFSIFLQSSNRQRDRCYR